MSSSPNANRQPRICCPEWKSPLQQKLHAHPNRMGPDGWGVERTCTNEGGQSGEGGLSGLGKGLIVQYSRHAGPSCARFYVVVLRNLNRCLDVSQDPLPHSHMGTELRHLLVGASQAALGGPQFKFTPRAGLSTSREWPQVRSAPGDVRPPSCCANDRVIGVTNTIDSRLHVTPSS